MKKIYNILIIVLVFFTVQVSAQKLSGKIVDLKGDPLENATVNWLNTSRYAITDDKGNFIIDRLQGDKKLIANFIAFIPDTIEIEERLSEITIQLKEPKVLKEVNVQTRRLDNYTSTIQTKNIETISSHELKKAPCCSLSESFVTNPTIDVVQTDAVTGTKEIQMLGLKGIYTQTLIENRPDLSGIASSYALDYIPGSWIESIQISKGASTVTSGFNSITGQINAELVKPYKDKPLYVNIFTNHEGRYEANLHLNKKFNSHLSSGILLHTSGQQNRDDHDHDGFIDNILRTTYSGLYRLFYITDKYTAQFNFQMVDDIRESGQYTHKPELDNESTFYHITQHNKRYNAFGKFAYLGLKGENESIGFLWHAIRHTINNKVNIRPLDADQTELYASLLYKNAIKSNPEHTINLGFTAQMDKSNQSFDKQSFSYNDRLAGAHAEYTYEPKDEHEGDHSILNNFGLIAGMRLDHHSSDGWIFTPRINLKYNFSHESIVRLSAGRGLRRARPFTDNIYQTANNKSWIIEPNLKLEDAWNFGGNFTHNFSIANRAGQFNIDAYKVIFKNQVVVDPDVDPTKIFVYSLQGISYSNTLLIGIQYELFKGFTAKLAYKYSDVKLDYLEGLRSQIFIPRDRGLLTLGYTTIDKKWSFNLVSSYTGTMRLADIDGIPIDLLHGTSDKSESFYRLDLQITRTWKQFEIYMGGENLTGYRQNHAILEHDFPTGDYFDASRIYGPLNGRMFNLGLRFWIE